MMARSTTLTKFLKSLLCVLVASTLLSCAKKPVDVSTRVLRLDYPAELGVVRRELWGWIPGDRTLPDHTINRITIHHGGEDFPADKDVLDYLPKFQIWCRDEKPWIDIPYHFSNRFDHRRRITNEYLIGAFVNRYSATSREHALGRGSRR